MNKPNARISSIIALTDSQNSPINLTAQSYLPLDELASEDITVAPNSYFLAVPFPAGVITAAFAWIRANEIIDLQVATIYNNQAVHAIPVSQAMTFFNISGLWLSSILGGTVHVVIGA